MAARTTNEPGLTKAPATRRKPMTRPGAVLGIAPDRSTKALVSAGLQLLGFEAQYLIEGSEGPFRVVSADYEPDSEIAQARAFITGALFAMRPPEPLADEVRTYRSEFARFMGITGQAVAGWSFGCGNKAGACIVVSSIRCAHQGLAIDRITTLGWRQDEACGWLCPTCAGTVMP